MKKKTAFGHFIYAMNWTITGLSHKTGISRPPLIAMETGKAVGMRFETMDRLCKALELDVGTLIALINSPPTDYPDERTRAFITQALLKQGSHPSEQAP